MFKNFDTAYKVSRICATIVFYLVVVSIILAYFMLSCMWRLITMAALSRKMKGNSTKGMFTAGVILRMSRGFIGNKPI